MYFNVEILIFLLWHQHFLQTKDEKTFLLFVGRLEHVIVDNERFYANQ